MLAALCVPAAALDPGKRIGGLRIRWLLVPLSGPDASGQLPQPQSVIPGGLPFFGRLVPFFAAGRYGKAAVWRNRQLLVTGLRSARADHVCLLDVPDPDGA